MPEPQLPPWGERLLDKMDDGIGRRRDRPAVGLKFPFQWISYIHAAARQRDISVAGYARRALVAFVCHDLGVEWDTLMRDEPQIVRFSQAGANKAYAGSDFGSWEIEKLR